MKRILGVLGIIATCAVLSAANIMAADNMTANENQKDECLLVAQTCADNVDSIGQRIERLNKEIAKGTDVYTTDELQILKNKLEDAVNLLDGLIRS